MIAPFLTKTFLKTIKMTELTSLWYAYYHVLQKNAPELLDQYIEETAAKLELTVDYFTAEFL